MNSIASQLITANKTDLITIYDIDHLQTRINKILPLEYYQFLISFNGGTLNFNKLLITINSDGFITESYLDKFFSLLEFERVYDIFYKQNKTGIDDIIQNNLAVIAVDNGGDNICIGLASDNFGNIFHWSGDLGIVKLAENLSDFFTNLAMSLQ